MRCFACTKRGHLAKGCRTKPSKKKKRPSPHTDEDFAPSTCVAATDIRAYSIDNYLMAGACDSCGSFPGANWQADQVKIGDETTKNGATGDDFSIVPSQTDFLFKGEMKNEFGAKLSLSMITLS